MHDVEGELEVQNRPGFQRFINKYIYVIGGFGVVVIVPQVWRIWMSQDIKGVSLITWVGFLVASFFWLFYGLVHKEKPLIFTNAAVCVLDLMIIVGILVHR